MIDWRIYERDVDIILAEEFYINPSFARWVLDRNSMLAGITTDVIEVRVSLSDDKGESDLVIVFEKADKSRFALLIEDKIDAGFQPDQASRYRLRGEAAREQGRWQEFAVILCAPRGYIEKSPSVSLFDCTISYEEIADWFRAHVEGRRGEYRADFLSSAAPLGASAYVKKTDSETDKFWNGVYDLAIREFPELEMKKPNYARQAGWAIFRPKYFPSRISVDLKAHTGCADLTFSAIPVSVLQQAVGTSLANNMVVTKAGASAVVRIKISEFSVPEGVAIIETKVRAGLDQCRDLVRFYRKHEAALSALVQTGKR